MKRMKSFVFLISLFTETVQREEVQSILRQEVCFADSRHQEGMSYFSVLSQLFYSTFLHSLGWTIRWQLYSCSWSMNLHLFICHFNLHFSPFSTCLTLPWNMFFDNRCTHTPNREIQNIQCVQRTRLSFGNSWRSSGYTVCLLGSKRKSNREYFFLSSTS